MSWSKAIEEILPPKSEITDGGSTLTLKDVSRHHAGVYRCAASNGVGRDATKEIHLQVLFEPEVKAERATVHAGVDYQVELVCVVYSEPHADVLWYKDTMLLDSNGKRYMQQKGNRHTMLIRDVELSDFGNYSCSASNHLGKARAYIKVQGTHIHFFGTYVGFTHPSIFSLSHRQPQYARVQQPRGQQEQDEL